MNTNSVSKLCGIAAIIVGTLVSSTAGAGVLIGTATLNTADDLTVIQQGATTYQFLDLTATLGLSQAAALAAYGANGFVLATNNDLTTLYSGFGFPFVSNGGADGLVELNATIGQAASFNAYVGSTVGNASLGSFLDMGVQSYTCISSGTCIPTNFNYGADFSGGQEELGVYLVRTAELAAAVPEPASLALLSLGLVGLGFFRRRNK